MSMTGQEQLDRLMKLMADLWYLQTHCSPPWPEIHPRETWIELAQLVTRTVAEMDNSEAR